MPPPDTPARERSPLLIAAAIVAALPVLYGLSYGPMLWLVGASDSEWALVAMNWFYTPLDFLCHRSKTFNDLLYRYAQLWGAP